MQAVILSLTESGISMWILEMGYGIIFGRVILFCALLAFSVGGATNLYNVCYAAVDIEQAVFKSTQLLMVDMLLNKLKVISECSDKTNKDKNMISRRSTQGRSCYFKERMK